eukprot:1160507-Pelagomonas_calceolata.AAC.7
MEALEIILSDLREKQTAQCCNEVPVDGCLLHVWVQSECRGIGDFDAPEVDGNLQAAVRALQQRPVLFKYCAEEVATARHNALFQVRSYFRNPWAAQRRWRTLSTMRCPRSCAEEAATARQDAFAWPYLLRSIHATTGALLSSLKRSSNLTLFL